MAGTALELRVDYRIGPTLFTAFSFVIVIMLMVPISYRHFLFLSPGVKHFVTHETTMFYFIVTFLSLRVVKKSARIS